MMASMLGPSRLGLVKIRMGEIGDKGVRLNSVVNRLTKNLQSRNKNSLLESYRQQCASITSSIIDCLGLPRTPG